MIFEYLDVFDVKVGFITHFEDWHHQKWNFIVNKMAVSTFL